MRNPKKIHIETLTSHLDRHMYWLKKKVAVISTVKTIIEEYPILSSPIGSFLAQDGTIDAQELLFLMDGATEGRIQHHIINFFTSYSDLKNNPRGLKSLKSFITDSAFVDSRRHKPSRYTSNDDVDIDIDIDIDAD